MKSLTVSMAPRELIPLPGLSRLEVIGISPLQARVLILKFLRARTPSHRYYHIPIKMADIQNADDSPQFYSTVSYLHPAQADEQ